MISYEFTLFLLEKYPKYLNYYSSLLVWWRCTNIVTEIIHKSKCKKINQI